MTFRSMSGVPDTITTFDAIRELRRQLPEAIILGHRRPHTGSAVLFVDETSLPTGSFKYRSAVSVLNSAKSGGDTELVAASSGNFGLALASVVAGSGIRVTLVVPFACPNVKVEAMRRSGAEVVLVPGEFADAADEALKIAKRRHSRLVSPDNDPFVIAGAASLAFDVFTRLALERDSDHNVVNMFSPYVGGGSFAGLIKGWEAAAVFVDNYAIPRANFVAVTFGETSETWSAGLKDRTIVRSDPTKRHFEVFAGDVEDGSPAFSFVGGDYELTRPVDEIAIEDATYFAWKRWNLKVETTAAATIAAALHHHMPTGVNVAVISGGNVDERQWRQVINRARRRIDRERVIPFGLGSSRYRPGWVKRDEQVAKQGNEPEVAWVTELNETGGVDDARALQAFGLLPLDPTVVRDRFFRDHGIAR